MPHKHPKNGGIIFQSGSSLNGFSLFFFQVTKQHNEDCKRLLRLMGVPVVEVIDGVFFGFIAI